MTERDDAPEEREDRDEASDDAPEKDDADQEEASHDEAAGEPDPGKAGSPYRVPARPQVNAGAKPTRPGYGFLIGWSAAFLAADLGTKYWAMHALSDKPKWKIIDGILAFDLVHNPGGAGGVLGDLPDHVRLPLFFLISAVAVAFIVSLFRKLEPRQIALKWALPLVLGGAAGNLVDRIRYSRVVDFIEVTRHWPTFNVADIWITVGVGLMVVDMFTPKPKKKKRAIRPNAPRAAVDERPRVERATEKG